MHIPGPIRVIVGATATIAIAIGCSTTTTAPTTSTLPQTISRGLSATFAVPAGFRAKPFDLQSEPARPVHGFISPKIKAPGGAMGFISDFRNFAVYIINTAGQITGTLTGFNNLMLGRFRGDFPVSTEGLHHGQTTPSGLSARVPA